ncbi:MAG: ABC transporter permease [Candidatus Competibacterales bacterium]
MGARLIQGITAPLLAALATVLVGGVLFAALGKPPLTALYILFIAPVSDLYGLGELGVKAAPLALCAIGLALGFRAGVWNIGAEGQLIMGAVAGGGVALAFPTAGPWLLPAMALAGALGGLAWGLIPALLKVKANANEILTSLMLVYVAELILGFLVHGPWRDPAGYGFPQSALFAEAALVPILVPGTRLHAGVLVALVALVGVGLAMTHTWPGFQLKVLGLAPRAAAYAGFSRPRLTLGCFAVSGALAGLAGLLEVAGPIGQLTPTISPGYGFAAIIVAFVGRLHPVGVALASGLLALLYLGGERAQIELNVPLAITGVFQGLLLFLLLGADGVVARWRRRRTGNTPIPRGMPQEER